MSTLAKILFFCIALSFATPAVWAQVPGENNYSIKIKILKGEERESVPFDLESGLIVFRATVAGKDVWAVLDNRSGGSLIDTVFARERGLRLSDPVGPVVTPTGSLERRRAFDIPVIIPGQLEFNAPLSVVDLSFLSKVTKRPIAFVLGKEYFENFSFLIDVRNRIFQVGPSGSLQTPPNVKFAKLIDSSPHVEVRIGDQIITATLDLGYNGTLAIRSEVWNRLGLGKIRTSIGRSADLQGKVFTTQRVIVPDIAVGPFNASNVTVSLQPLSLEQRDGIIGVAFLSKFNFALDIKAGKLWLIP